MLQRIQTVYLLISLILMALMIFQPLVEFHSQEELVYLLSAFGIEDLQDTGILIQVRTYPIAIIIALIVVINFLSIFLYKKRVLQMRLCTYNIIFMLGSLVMIYFYASQIATETETTIQYAWADILPLIAVILNILAIRGIRKDEKLVRSMDRIR